MINSKKDTLIFKINQMDVLFVTSLTDDAEVISCTKRYKDIWLVLNEASETLHKSTHPELPKEIENFLLFMEKNNILPVESLDIARSIISQHEFTIPIEGTYSSVQVDEVVEAYAQGGGPSDGHTYDSYYECWTPGTYYEDACA